MKGGIENWEELVDGDGSMFEYCESAETDAREQELTRYLWRE